MTQTTIKLFIYNLRYNFFEEIKSFYPLSFIFACNRSKENLKGVQKFSSSFIRFDTCKSYKLV